VRASIESGGELIANAAHFHSAVDEFVAGGGRARCVAKLNFTRASCGRSHEYLQSERLFDCI